MLKTIKITSNIKPKGRLLRQIDRINKERQFNFNKINKTVNV